MIGRTNYDVWFVVLQCNSFVDAARPLFWLSWLVMADCYRRFSGDFSLLFILHYLTGGFSGERDAAKLLPVGNQLAERAIQGIRTEVSREVCIEGCTHTKRVYCALRRSIRYLYDLSLVEHVLFVQIVTDDFAFLHGVSSDYRIISLAQPKGFDIVQYVGITEFLRLNLELLQRDVFGNVAQNNRGWHRPVHTA